MNALWTFISGELVRVPFFRARKWRHRARRALSRVWRALLAVWGRCPKFARSVWRALGQDKGFIEENLILAPGERIIISTRYHLLWLLRDYRSWTKLSGLAVTLSIAWLIDQAIGWVLSGGLWWMTAILWALFVAHGAMFLYQLLQWRASLFIATTVKPIWVHGVFHHAVKPITVPGTADIQITQTLIGRIFGYGELRIAHTLYSIDPDVHHVFEYLPRPRRVHQAIVLQQHFDLSRRSSRPGSTAGRRHSAISEAAYE